MATLASATAASLHQDAPRSRGLRRQRHRGLCPPVSPTPLPAAPTAVELLALLTRVRSVRVASGELGPTRLYDLRAWKTSWAELAYLHRLAGGGRHGGTVVTSMRQLVSGIAALHPSWKLTGDPWQDRDCHHQSVRRRLSGLAGAGLLQWRVGVDEDLEERRTELVLLPVPELFPDELTAAAARLERWEARYGSALNTGSPIAISDVREAAAPLDACERRCRGRQRARQAAQARRRAGSSQTNSAPPFGAPSTSEKSKAVEISSNVEDITHACGERTRDTRTNAKPPRNAPPSAAFDEDISASAALQSQKAASKKEGSGTVRLPELDHTALIARVAARSAQREPLLQEIALQAERRTVELAGWGLDRAWPVGRLREGWVVARYGSRTAAEYGAGASGPLYPDDHARLRRAVARYERNAAGAPDGFPTGGLGALLHLATLAGAAAGPRTLRYAIGALDQLTRRMRAHATRDSVTRLDAATRRAERRQHPRPTRYQFRLPGPFWPRWVTLNAQGNPVLAYGSLLVDEAQASWAPAPNSEAYRSVARDAYLLAGAPLPPHLDGRTAMSMRAHGQLAPATRPTGYYPDRGVTELAHRGRLSLQQAARIAEPLRTALLTSMRLKDAQDARESTARLGRALSQATSGLPPRWQP